MTREQRLARMRELLDGMRKYLRVTTERQEPTVIEAKAVEIARQRRRRPSTE